MDEQRNTPEASTKDAARVPCEPLLDGPTEFVPVPVRPPLAPRTAEEESTVAHSAPAKRSAVMSS